MLLKAKKRAFEEESASAVNTSGATATFLQLVLHLFFVFCLIWFYRYCPTRSCLCPHCVHFYIYMPTYLPTYLLTYLPTYLPPVFIVDFFMHHLAVGSLVLLSANHCALCFVVLDCGFGSFARSFMLVSLFGCLCKQKNVCEPVCLPTTLCARASFLFFL